jgi:hypothetical protein
LTKNQRPPQGDNWKLCEFDEAQIAAASAEVAEATD